MARDERVAQGVMQGRTGKKVQQGRVAAGSGWAGACQGFAGAQPAEQAQGW